MNILVVSEAFDNGGVETQIKTYYESLPRNVKMIFAFGKYTEKIKLDNAKIYTGFNFSYIDTIKEFCEDVNRLVEIIKKEKIDAIHVHPYYSFFAAYFASQITNTNLFYTFHGISSFNFLKTPISQAIFQYSFESLGVASVLSVSNDGINCFKNFPYSRVILLPNPINLRKFPIAQIKDNGHWVLISRLDSDKLTEIKLLIKNMKKYKIKKLDIFGSGSEIENLKSYLLENKLNKDVNFMGYSYNLYQDLNNKYNGVIGIGRVLLETLSMGYPTILIGYNKVTGFVNMDIFNKIKNNNFSNINLNEENYNFPNSKEMVQIRDEIRNNYNSEIITAKYLDIIKNNMSTFKQNIKDLYAEIELLNRNDEINICSFHKERMLYNLIYKYIGKYTLDPKTYNIFVNTNLNYELFDIMSMRVLEMKGMIENEKN